MISILQANSKLTNADGSAFVVDEDCIQPNAIDIRVGSIYKISSGSVVLNDSTKSHLKRDLVESHQGIYVLESGKYDITFNMMIEMSSDESGYLIQRSTLNRNGILVTSGLYDSGYKGIVGGCLHIPSGVTLTIGVNERLAQLLIFKSESVKLYDGSYQTDSKI